MEAVKKKTLFGKEVDMLSGSIVKGLITIAIPVMIMNVTMSLINVIDMSVLKAFDTDGGYSVGAVGACGTLISLISGLLIGCSAGANVAIAKRIGRGDREGAEKTVGTAILFSLLGGIALTVIGVSCAELFLGWMNCPDELLPQAALYFRLYFAGVPILMVYNFCAAILRSTGDSTRPMIYLLSGGVLKVLFNLLLVGVFHLGVVGVAIATIISWAFSCVLGLRALLTNDSWARLKLSRLRLYKTELIDMLTVGIPAGLQQALYSIANVIITATVNSYGPDATTGISIANNFDGVLYQVSIATSYAVLPYVSQNIGRGNVKRATQAIWRGMLITVAMGATIGALSAIFSGQLASLMTDSPAVIEYAKQKMIIISSTYFICGINEIMCAAMRGFGKPIIPTISTLIFMCAIRFFWVYVVFPSFDSMTILYLIWPIGWVLSIATILCFFFPTLKALKQKVSPSEGDDECTAETEEIPV